jgi:hypothetical protein
MAAEQVAALSELESRLLGEQRSEGRFVAERPSSRPASPASDAALAKAAEDKRAPRLASPANATPCSPAPRRR